MSTLPRRRSVARLDPNLNLTLRMGRGVRVSDRAFAKICDANPLLRIERTARGNLEIMSPAFAGSGGRNVKLSTRLGRWVEDTGLEKDFDSSTGFTLPNSAIRSPDASWVAEDRWVTLTEEQRERSYSPICPDFVAELRSFSGRPSDFHAKMLEYLDQGVRLGWLLDPIQAKVWIYRPGREVEMLVRPLTLSGEDVLPGFVLDLKKILFD